MSWTFLAQQILWPWPQLLLDEMIYSRTGGINIG